MTKQELEADRNQDYLLMVEKLRLAERSGRTFRMYANPYNICMQCRKQTTWGYLTAQGKFVNLPCGHHADFISACPSWSPVDGCNCPVECMIPELVKV